MEAACKAASRTAQLLTKDTPQEEVSLMTAVMASVKEQLSKVRVTMQHVELNLNINTVFLYIYIYIYIYTLPVKSFRTS